jgi:hypothetical protein
MFLFLRHQRLLSRVVVEARMMGMSSSNKWSLVGASNEPWFELKGEDLSRLYDE